MLRLFHSSFMVRRRFHFPAPLRSTVVTRFFATTSALTPAGRRSRAVWSRQVSPLHVTRTSARSVSNHLSPSRAQPVSCSRGCCRRLAPTPPHGAWGFGLRHCARGLATTTGRIEFDYCLPTKRSLPAALHPASRRRSCVQLPGAGLTRTGTFTQPFQCAHGRTGAGVSPALGVRSPQGWLVRGKDKVPVPFPFSFLKRRGEHFGSGRR